MAIAVQFRDVEKVFQHRPTLANILGRERTGTTVAVRELNFKIESGEAIALLGPNGSGKTTILKLITEIFLPDKGRVEISQNMRVGFAVANERSFFPRLTARENLQFFATLDDVPKSERPGRITEALAEVGLTDAEDTLAMKFSTGMFQRLGLARAIVTRPGLLLLDEPTRSLDAEGTQHFWDLTRTLHQGGTTLVLATHDLEEAATVTRRGLFLRAGVLLADQVLTDSSVGALRDLYHSLEHHEVKS